MGPAGFPPSVEECSALAAHNTPDRPKLRGSVLRTTERVRHYFAVVRASQSAQCRSIG